MENINYTYFNRENNDSNSKKKRVIKKSYLRNISKFSNLNIPRSNNSRLKGIYYIERSNKYKLTIIIYTINRPVNKSIITLIK